ncbi:MAG: glycoside hydrolase family 9 protein, partial [Ruminococcus sp.]|nr:glycoside hydrolase family 9 protein [Ruminococcus sp.]
MRFKKAVAAIASTLMLSTTICSSLTAPAAFAAETDINYAEALALSLYFYDANECGCEVDEGPLTWRGDCHVSDATSSLDNAVGLGSTEKELIKTINGTDTVDVSGGYHDAGDHVKFNLTMGFNATSLGWAYYDYPEVFQATGTEAHLLDVLQNTCDYFMKTTYLDANNDVIAFCYNVGDSSDHNDWLSPENQTAARKTYWATASGNNSGAAFEMASALATTSHAFKDIDAAYAEECLKYAEALYEFGANYPGYTQDGQGDMYGAGSYVDEKAWAEAWLYVADSENHSLPTIVPSGGYYGSELDNWVYCWDKVWGGYACLMYELTGDSRYATEIKYEMDMLVSDKSQAYYPISGWGTSRYNCAWQKYAITYSEGQGDSEYLNYAKNQMDYILGNNPTGYSFLLGYGDKSPVKIHHRAANPNRDECTYTLYGALVGGPTTANGDYEDNTERYQYTEPALDYNACFTLAITGLLSHFGGDTTTAEGTIAAASEIKDDFEFVLEGYVPGEVAPIVTTVTT